MGEKCAACGRFVKNGEGCPVHDPHYKDDVMVEPRLEVEKHG